MENQEEIFFILLKILITYLVFRENVTDINVRPIDVKLKKIEEKSKYKRNWEGDLGEKNRNFFTHIENIKPRPLCNMLRKLLDNFVHTCI